MQKGDKRQSIKDKYNKLPYLFKAVLVISDDATKVSYIPTGRQWIGQENTNFLLDTIHLRIKSYGIKESYYIFTTHIITWS